jgi:hypothetical protein
MALALLPFAGCAGITCSGVGGYAVQVEVRDAVTGASAVEGAVLTVTDGAYADSARGGPGAPPVLAAAPERPGTYTATVRRAGYAEWSRTGVRVGRSGSCGTLDVARLTALLQPLRGS